MNEKKRGYIGGKRSVRSDKAIRSYEVPVSMINKTLITEFIKKHRYYYSQNELDCLRDISVAKWRYVAKERIKSSSWHHTSSFYNETNHYDMKKIAKFLIEKKNSFEEEYKQYLASQKVTDTDFRYAVFNLKFWEGLKSKPQSSGLKEISGILVGDWFFHKEYHAARGKTRKTSIKDGNMEWIKIYENYEELVKGHFDFYNTEETFDALISEKIK